MKKLVTVYGSLLSGLGNWSWCLKRPDCELKGEHVLEIPVRMLSLGGFPGLIETEEKNKILVETYEVPEEVYRNIERLEGYRGESNKDFNMYNKMAVETPFGPSEIYIYNSRNVYAADRFVPKDKDGVISWRKYRQK